jgi:hypothetical protein
MSKSVAAGFMAALTACAPTTGDKAGPSSFDKSAMLVGMWKCTEADGQVKIAAEYFLSGRAVTLTEMQAERDGAAMILRLLVDGTWQWTRDGLLKTTNTKARVLPVLIGGEEVALDIPGEMLALVEGKTTLSSIEISARQMRTDSGGVLRECVR